MDLSDALKDMKDKQVDLEPDMAEVLEETTKKVGKDKPEKDRDNSPLTFEEFKRKVGTLLLEDPILIQMKLKWYEDATQMIVFQGVRSNVIARLRSNGQHVINRSVFKKRITQVLEFEMEPSEEQRLGKERATKPHLTSIKNTEEKQDQ
jgi:hypothetical protein